MLQTRDEQDISLYTYDLPREMIAQTPADPRDSSRLMIIEREGSQTRHAVFREIGQFLRPSDLLVVNDTRVFPARTLGFRSTGGKVEVFFLHEQEPGKWEAMVRCNGSPRPGEQLMLEEDRLLVRLITRTRMGHWIVGLPRGMDLMAKLAEFGRVPLPPYIKRDPEHQREPEDVARYQTVYARTIGAVAAPTAGMHFTRSLMEELEGRGITFAQVTLHIGPGTFQPIKVDNLNRHNMHAEFYDISAEMANTILEARNSGRRVIAVGTTTCRALESAAAHGNFGPQREWTRLFIRSPYEFRIVDGLLTNFHLPCSSLLVMVSAFAGRKRILDAYEIARQKGYRFYSYGDAMLIL
jgi:S-adenosylmethionine:tRNA ribosyltransferase-isomerase